MSFGGSKGELHTMTNKHEQQQPFSNAARAEAAQVIKNVANEIVGRPAVDGITIDGPTSRDLDDAFWLEMVPDKGYTLQISIADVGSLITPTATPALAREAFERAFTRYYAHGNTPMLPAMISAGKLSLHEAQLCPTITITLPLDQQLRFGEPYIQPTVLKSRKRLSYEEVDQEIDNPQTPIATMLQMALDLSQRLLQARRAKGALAIYNISAGWTTTEEGLLRPLGEGERYKSHIITQEFMILANQIFALYLAERGIPALYRNHTASPIAPARDNLVALMETASMHPERVRATVNLALGRATYAPNITGHFGLNLSAYLHMTSPLRRYADLLNQHILHAVLQNTTIPYTKTHLDAYATHLNREEQESKEARKSAFLSAYDNEIQQLTTEPSLTHLDAKQFHSVLRIAAANSSLQTTVEEEIYRRLQEHQLQANDLFTLIFRFRNSGPQWDELRRAAIQSLSQTPHLAISMLQMGQQILSWGEPVYEIANTETDYGKNFTARAMLMIADQQYISSRYSAAQKEKARQTASVNLVARIAGIELPEQTMLAETSNSEPGPIQNTPTTPAETGTLANFKGQLQELAQAQKWHTPTYGMMSRSGPSHAPTFTVEGQINVHNQIYTATASATTRIRAEQLVAQQLLQAVPRPTVSDRSQHIKRSREKNPVSQLNEWKQQHIIRDVMYTYTTSDTTNEQRFTCTCQIEKQDGTSVVTNGTGSTKKTATQAAAEQALHIRTNANDDIP
jgi:ribonuclease R